MSAASRELVQGGIRAAREARRELARLVHELDDDPTQVGHAVSQVVGTLFSAEVGGLDRVSSSLTVAETRLREVLEGQAGGDGPVAGTISRALALIHPARERLAGARRGGERSEGRGGREDTAPFELNSARVKGAPPPDTDERRDSERATLELEIGLEGDNRFYTGKTGDLSKGGLFIATETPLAVDTELVLSFVLPDGYRVSAEGTVAWVRAPRYRPHELPVGMGVRFEALGEKDRRAIEHYLEQRPAFRYGD